MTGTKDKRFARIEIDGFPAPAQPTQAAPLPPTVVPVADPVARVQGDRAVIERIAGRKVADTVYAEGEAVIDLGVDNARKARAAFDKLPLFTEACSGLVNRIVSSGGTLTIYEPDDTTSLGTQALTTDAAAEPIVEANTT